MRVVPISVPWWAVVAPLINIVVLVGTATGARALRGPGYDPVNQTLSSLAETPRYGWVMTAGFVAAALCYILTGVGLRALAGPARLTIVVAGLAGLVVAATREDPNAALSVHQAAVAVGGAALVVWPLLTVSRAPGTPLPRRVPVAMTVSAVLGGLGLWLLYAANTGGPVGLAERVAIVAQMVWPAVVAVAVWSVARRPQLGDGDAHALEQDAGQRQTDPDHRGRIAVDPVDEPAAESVEGEGAGHPQRFAGREVGLQIRR